VWLLGKGAKEIKSPSHVYVFVNIQKAGLPPAYYVVPSTVVARKMTTHVRRPKNKPPTTWYGFRRNDAPEHEGDWSLFGRPD
jgi:hypothetical protein